MKKTIKPPALVQGDSVAVIAPSGLVNRNDIEDAITTIESWGLTVLRGEHLYDRYGIFAGTDDKRLADLQKAFDDPGIKAIFCARGGYGMSRIIRSVDFRVFIKKPKWVIGYSDISVLHLFINCKFGIETLHAEMPLNYHSLKSSSLSILTLQQSLFGNEEGYEWQSGLSVNGKAKGVLAGGNLSLISNLLGTEIKNYLKGKILFIEEKGEYIYSLDRMITGMDLAGVLQDIKGLIIGGLTDIKESDIKYETGVRDIIIDMAGRYGYPVAFDFPAGHIADNRAIMLGRNIKLEVSDGLSSLQYL